jgi:hypothetical protein
LVAIKLRVVYVMPVAVGPQSAHLFSMSIEGARRCRRSLLPFTLERC